MVRDCGRVATARKWVSSGALAVLMAACSSAGDPSDDIEPVVVEETTTTEMADESAPDVSADAVEEADVAAEVEEAYHSAWAAFEAAAAAGDPESPALTQAMHGEALDGAQGWISERALRGESVSFPEPGQSRIDVMSIESTSDGSAVVVSCIVDDAVVVQTASGAVVNDHVSIVVMREAMIRIEGSWRLENREMLSEGETPECAL